MSYSDWARQAFKMYRPASKNGESSYQIDQSKISYDSSSHRPIDLGPSHSVLDTRYGVPLPVYDALREEPQVMRNFVPPESLRVAPQMEGRPVREQRPSRSQVEGNSWAEVAEFLHGLESKQTDELAQYPDPDDQLPDIYTEEEVREIYSQHREGAPDPDQELIHKLFMREGSVETDNETVELPDLYMDGVDSYGTQEQGFESADFQIEPLQEEQDPYADPYDPESSLDGMLEF